MFVAMNVRMLRNSLTAIGCRPFLERSVEHNLIACSRFYCNIDNSAERNLTIKLSTQSIINEISKNVRGTYFDHASASGIVDVLNKYNFTDKEIVTSLSRNPKLLFISNGSFVNVMDILKNMGLTVRQSFQLFSCNTSLEQPETLENLQEVIAELKSKNLMEYQIQDMMLRCPQLLSSSVLDIKTKYTGLKRYFTIAEARTLLYKCPNVIIDDVRETAKKIAYVHNEMGVNAPLMAKSEFLKHSFNSIMLRHKFIERLGVYKNTNPARDNPTPLEGGNPLVKDIFQTNDKNFVRSVARSTLEEFETFKDLMEYETKQQIEDNEDTDEEYDDDDDDDEEEEED